jgi:hypothetical protein
VSSMLNWIKFAHFNIRHVLLILAGFCLQACQFNLNEDIQKLEQSIESKGTNIVRLDNVMDIPVDNNELVGGRSAIANPGTLKLLTDKRYLLFLKKLSQEIEKYPNDVLKKYLDNIFIGGQILNTNEQYFSGFYHPGTQNIYLFPLVFDMPNFEDATTIRSTIHHEISSILLRKYRFDMIGFMAYNGFEIEYWNDEDYLLENPPPSYYASDALLTEGLLTHYAQTSPENDYNGYVEVAFAYPEIMSKYCSRYDRIKLKYEFIKKFYLKISPDFQPVFDQVRCDNAVNSGV